MLTSPCRVPTTNQAFTVREAKLAFVWSRMVVIDEMKRSKYTCLDFYGAHGVAGCPHQAMR